MDCVIVCILYVCIGAGHVKLSWGFKYCEGLCCCRGNMKEKAMGRVNSSITFFDELSCLLRNESLDVVIKYHGRLEKTTVVQLWV
jgi:hypothetical protein